MLVASHPCLKQLRLSAGSECICSIYVEEMGSLRLWQAAGVPGLSRAKTLIGKSTHFYR